MTEARQSNYEVSEIEPLLELFEQPAFATLARQALREYMGWDELLRSPLPPGMSAVDTWKALTAIRRLGALWHPLRDLDGRRYWFTMTHDAARCLEIIGRHCRGDSSFHKAVLEREGRRFVVRSRIREAIATCQLDGIDVDYESVGRMLHEDRAPRSSEEQLVLNSYRLLTQLDDLADEPFTPALIRRLYDLVAEGVDPDTLTRSTARNSVADIVSPRPVTDVRQAEALMVEYCAWANGEIGDEHEPVPAKAFALMTSLVFWHLLPDFNGIVARAVLRIFAIKNDYPVLGYLPVSRMTQQWVDGEIAPPRVKFGPDDIPSIEPAAAERDYTPDVLTFLQLTVVAIEDLQQHMSTTRDRDEELLGRLEHEAELNYRQRAVISRALQHPDAEFRIRYHQTTHHVVYATARADLLELVKRGYLRQEMRGRTFVFVPVHDLRLMFGGGHPDSGNSNH